MNKKISRIFITLLIAICTLCFFTACSNKADEYRKEGIEQIQKGQYEDAITTLDKALEESNGKITKKQFDILLYRAEAEYMTSDYTASQHTISVLKEVDGDNDTYSKMEAQINAKLLIKAATEALDKDDLETARQKLDEAAAAGLSNDKDQEYDEVVYLEKTGEWKQAYDAMTTYLSHYPDDKDAEREMSFLKTRVEGLREQNSN